MDWVFKTLLNHDQVSNFEIIALDSRASKKSICSATMQKINTGTYIHSHNLSLHLYTVLRFDLKCSPVNNQSYT